MLSPVLRELGLETCHRTARVSECRAHSLTRDTTDILCLPEIFIL